MSAMSVTADLSTHTPAVRVVYQDARDGQHGIHLTTAEADALAAELLRAATEARANERRCGTCSHYDPNPGPGYCRWTGGHTDAPDWVAIGKVKHDFDRSHCPAWTKREGGQPT